MSISVIVCTYNPDIKLLTHVLSAVFKASEIREVQEILIVDNNSPVPISKREEINELALKQPQLRFLVERRQGLTYARLCGIKNSAGNLLIFIDDDNIINEDYFAEAEKIYNDFPYIGSFSGQVELTFNQTPPDWTKKYWGMLVHRRFSGNHWGNKLFDNSIMPNGAGLCIRREVAVFYLLLHDKGDRKFILDRNGNSLLSGGDNDLAMCACDIGLGMGLFEKLFLKHFITTTRFKLGYLKRLTYGIEFSSVVLKYMRTGKVEQKSKKRLIYDWLKSFILSKEDGIIQRFSSKGYSDGIKYLFGNKL